MILYDFIIIITVKQYFCEDMASYFSLMVWIPI